jgi:uncharacterized membrane protein
MPGILPILLNLNCPFMLWVILYFVFCHTVYQCYCKGLSEIMIYKSKIKRYKWIRLGFGLWYLTPLSTIFQLYHGDQCIGGSGMLSIERLESQII